jgi:hypothetical protein
MLLNKLVHRVLQGFDVVVIGESTLRIKESSLVSVVNPTLLLLVNTSLRVRFHNDSG